MEKKIVTSDHRRPHQETIRNTVNPKNSRRNEICIFFRKKRKASHNTSTHNNTKGKKCVNWEKRKKKCRKVGQIGWPCQRLPTYPQVQFSVSLNVPRDEITPGATNTLGAKTNKQKKIC